LPASSAGGLSSATAAAQRSTIQRTFAIRLRSNRVLVAALPAPAEPIVTGPLAYSPTESVTHFLVKLVFAAPASFLSVA
jgi:hypothetical protein